jgi:hypothetical protein
MTRRPGNNNLSVKAEQASSTLLVTILSQISKRDAAAT